MKIFFLFSLLLVSSLAQAESSSDVLNYLEGLLTGLHLERLAPAVERCYGITKIVVKAFEGAIEAYKEHQPPYNFMNNVTSAIGTISPMARICVEVPEDIWKHLLEDYIKKFNYSWAKYFQAVLLNLGAKADEVLWNFVKIVKYLEEKNYRQAGYYSGNMFNLIFNVTSPVPIPPPPPFMEYMRFMSSTGNNYEHDVPVVREFNPRYYQDIHNDFRKYYNYTMIVLNYTKWINTTTANNLNSSVMNIEYKIYTAIMEFMKPKPNIKEAILLITDTLAFLNPLYNGFYFLFEQLPKKIFKDSVFEHIEYLPLNLLQHIGYFIWNGYKLYYDYLNDKPFDACRRVAIIFRKFLYFDEDVLDDIHSHVEISRM